MDEIRRIGLSLLSLSATRFALRNAQSRSYTLTQTFSAARFFRRTLATQVGGETATGLGGAFSTGGRCVRQQIGVAISHLIRLQVSTDTLVKSGSNLTQILAAILDLCHSSTFEREKGFFSPAAPNSPQGGFNTQSPIPTSSSTSTTTSTDIKVAQLIANFVLRSGIGSQGENAPKTLHHGASL